MSEHEKMLRKVLGIMSGVVPKIAGEGLVALEGLLDEQKATALDDAIEHFTDKQKDLDRRRIGKGLTPEQRADMKTDAGRSGWAAQQLRMEQGRRKKGKEKAG